MRLSVSIVAWVVLLLAGCGSSGGANPPGTGSPPTQPTPTIDVAALRSEQFGVAVHLYRDVLALPTSGAAPDVKVDAPLDVAQMAFTGTHLLVAQNLTMPNLDRFFVYSPADLAAPNPSPSVSVVVPPPSGVQGAALRDFEVWDDDVYVYTVYDDGLVPTTFTMVTHVWRDLTTLASGDTPDAVVTHGQYTTTSFSMALDSIAVDDDVLLATGFGRVYVSLDPDALVGAVVPDQSLDQLFDLDMAQSGTVVLGGGEAYFFRGTYIAGFDDAAGLVAGREPRFELSGASDVFTAPDAVVRVGDRLFSRGAIGYAPVPVVGFDVGGPVADFSPPDVQLGPPSTLTKFLSGATDVLVSGSNSGVIEVYPNASLLRDGDEPTVYLWDAELGAIKQVRAVER